MAPRLSRLERMTNLVLALLRTPRPLSLREIGSEVAGYPSGPGPLRQAFERDKRTLRDDGIPISVERIDGEDQVGYRIVPEDYYLPDLGLTTEESEALGIALSAVRLEGATPGDVADKLGAPHLSVPPLAVLPSLPELPGIQAAVRARATVAFVYNGRRREVEGYGLVFRSGAWYFVGHDRSVGDDGALRTFRVDRIVGAVEAGEPNGYVVPEGLDVAGELRFAPFAAGGDRAARSVVALVDVDSRAARAVSALAGEAAIEHRSPDGSVRVRLTVGDEGSFLSFVLGLGDAAEVLEPPELRAEVIAALQLAATGGPT